MTFGLTTGQPSEVVIAFRVQASGTLIGPGSMTETLGFWKDDLWTYPGTRRLVAGDRHRGIFSAFITDLGLTRNDVNDAWLAALAIESRATLVSTDQGFDRFPGLAWINPVKSA